jgi:hypothetical protein
LAQLKPALMEEKIDDVKQMLASFLKGQAQYHQLPKQVRNQTSLVEQSDY